MSSTNRKKIKKAAKRVLKKNYFKSIIVVFIVGIIINGGYNYITFKYNKAGRIPVSLEEKHNSDIINESLRNILDKESDGDESNLNGAIAPIVNNITKSKSITLGFLNSINMLIFKDNISVGIISMIAAFTSLTFYIFVRNIIKIGSNRYFLEQRVYKNTGIYKVLFPYRVKRTLNLSFVMLLKELFFSLWCLTIVGGFIKHYEYLMIPYILAENPDIKYKDAFRISKEMMDGNKWETFKLDLTLLGWNILSFLSIGITGLFYSNAYIECIYSELYIDIRNDKLSKIHNSKLLNDKYLINPEGNTYPENKFSLPMLKIKISHLDYNIDYKISTYILFFFTFAFLGWAWEVFYHLLLDGTFVNRGTMFGPWLPIYGFGGLLVLILLKPLRNRHVLFLIGCTIISGLIEYLTAWYLETFNHMKWWDYTGYFLNIKGRVCLEGLIVFALGGAAVTYFAAPLLNNIYSKIKSNIKIIICIVLIVLFLIDFIYSTIHPNVGEGVTFLNNKSWYIYKIK